MDGPRWQRRWGSGRIHGLRRLHYRLDHWLTPRLRCRERPVGCARATSARWIGRLLTETPPMTVTEARWATAIVEQLPRCQESVRRISRQR
jgi:hypothetical protein